MIRRLAAILVALTLPLVVAACGNDAGPADRTPRGVAETYATALVKGDGDMACNVLTVNSKARIVQSARESLESSSADGLGCEQIVSGLGRQLYGALRPDVGRGSGGDQTFEVRVAWRDKAGRASIRKTLRLVRRGDRWLIDQVRG